MTDTPGPLAKMMVDNADMIEQLIEKEGASPVAEFFINTGTALAAMYGLSDMPQEEIAPIGAREDDK
jgi:hypothetical protein